jgi:hypothetical protein
MKNEVQKSYLICLNFILIEIFVNFVCFVVKNKNIKMNIQKFNITLFIIVFHSLCAASDPVIYPPPQEAVYTDKHFTIDENWFIRIPSKASYSDTFLAEFLQAELVDKFGLALFIKNNSGEANQIKQIIIGSIKNPLVEEIATNNGIIDRIKGLNKEGYYLKIDENGIYIAGKDEAGAFYGLQSVRQLLSIKDDRLVIRQANVFDWPLMEFRGIRLMMPGPENVTFFKRFLRDFMAYFKYNKVIIEANANIRLTKHPELNAGTREFYQDMIFSRRDRPKGPNKEYQDSGHQDAADGTILEAAEVRSIVRFARNNFIDVIPEIPSLTHSYYLLTRHRELAEIQNAEWPDTYCPSRPESYKLLFDVFEEYIRIMNPNTVHIGHDEWRMAMDVCPLCKEQDYNHLFIKDINLIHKYFTDKNIRISMWADHLLESVRNNGPRQGIVKETNYTYNKPGALTPFQVEKNIPKDILLFNWCWNEKSNRPGRKIPNRGQHNDAQLEEWGFQQVYGNMTPNISNYEQRVSRKSLIGGAPSAWMASKPFNFGKDLLYYFVGCANYLWSDTWLDREQIGSVIAERMPLIRQRLTGQMPPSKLGNQIHPLNLTKNVNDSYIELLHLEEYPTGRDTIRSNQLIFNLVRSRERFGRDAIIVNVDSMSSPAPKPSSPVILLNKDVNSLVFLHACRVAARNQKAQRAPYNYQDTADMLGWYEIEYSDGFTTSIPIRYGVNIKEWNATLPLCYQADPVILKDTDAQDGVIFYAFEWPNQRMGQKIKSIKLNATRGFTDYKNEGISNNSIILLAISYVKTRKPNDEHMARYYQYH